YGGSRTDHRSDQYSLAATIYSLLTKQPPADSIERMMNKQDLVPAQRLNAKVPKHVEAALARALELDQEDRFPDIQTFKAALQGQLQAPTVRKPLPKSARPARARLPLLLFGGLGGIGILLLGGGALLALSGGRFGLSSGQAATPTSSTSPTANAALIGSASPVPRSETPEPSSTPEPPPTAPAEPLTGGGGRIAFASDRENRSIFQIWTMNPDGSDPLQLTFGPGNKTQPRWSPDGQRILFVFPGGQDTFGNDLGLDIWVMNADGSPPLNLTHNAGDDTDPAWSPVWTPDGGDIAFTSTRNGDVRLVFLMRVSCPALDQPCTAEKPRSITMTGTYAPEYSPAWSHDGGQMAVIAAPRGARGRIYIGNPGGGGALFDRSERLIGVDTLRWSPDGVYLIFTWQIASGRNEIYRVPVANPRDPSQLTNTLGNKEPAYSADGEWIAFTSTRDQNLEIYLMTSAGGEESNLTNHPARDMQPDWQPVLLP
ncbi:MAG TPA: hypothetical protein VGA32_01500, partial [Anaerolineales bacterium]